MQKKQSLLGTSNGSFSVVRVHCIDADFGDHKLISHYSPNFAEALQNIFEENQSITKYQSNRTGLPDFLSARILQFIYIPNMFSRQINAFALTKCTLTLHAIALYDLVIIANCEPPLPHHKRLFCRTRAHRRHQRKKFVFANLKICPCLQILRPLAAQCGEAVFQIYLKMKIAITKNTAITR